MQHTPGPWKYGYERPTAQDPEEQWAIVTIAGGHIVANVNPDSRQDANARLIAAAPDLLAALEAVVFISDRKHDAWDKARAAIAKAKGQQS